jgi:hypothetical protein
VFRFILAFGFGVVCSFCGFWLRWARHGNLGLVCGVAVGWLVGGFQLQFWLFSVLGSVVMSPFLQLHGWCFSSKPNPSIKRDALKRAPYVKR